MNSGVDGDPLGPQAELHVNCRPPFARNAKERATHCADRAREVKAWRCFTNNPRGAVGLAFRIFESAQVTAPLNEYSAKFV